MSKDGNEKVARLLVIGELFNNNAELFKLITKQIYLLEKYKEFIDTIADTDEYIDEFNKLLSLVGLTSSGFDNELDDEVGGKS